MILSLRTPATPQVLRVENSDIGNDHLSLLQHMQVVTGSANGKTMKIISVGARTVVTRYRPKMNCHACGDRHT